MASLSGPVHVSTRDPESSGFQNSGRASLNLLSLAISMGSTSSPSGIQGLDSPRSADPNSIHPCIGHSYYGTLCTLQCTFTLTATLTLNSRLSGTPRPPGRRGRKPLGSAFCCKACNVSGWLERRRNLAMTSQTVFLSPPNCNALTTPPDPLAHPLAGTHIHLAVNSALLL